jgi:DNA replicative helicase MCM subunit Mcm2 (Cdc46/Mcm family)
LNNNNNDDISHSASENISIRPATLIELHKAGFKLIALSAKNKVIESWTPIYEDPNYWTAERLANPIEYSKFVNVATVFGKTHIKDEQGLDLYLNCFDADSDYVYKVFTTLVQQLSWIDSVLKSKIQNPIAKTGDENVKCLLDYLKLVTCVVKTRKSYGVHVYWLSHKQNNRIRTEDCKPGYEFEIKTDKGSAHATLPPSTHRHAKNFRYEHLGRTDKLKIFDELYDILIELFAKKCLVSANVNGGSSNSAINENEKRDSTNAKDDKEEVRKEEPSSGKKQQSPISPSNIILYNLSDEMIETSIAYLIPYYIEHHHNEFTLLFSGTAFHSKIAEESAAKILKGICSRTGDNNKIYKRLQVLDATFKKGLSGEEIVGAPRLAEFVSKIKGMDIGRANKVASILKLLWHSDIRANNKSYATEEQHVGSDNSTNNHDHKVVKELSVSQTIREKEGYIKVTGQLIGQSLVYNMISAVNRDCYNCGYHDKVEYKRPLFKSPTKEIRKCPICSESSHSLEISCQYFSTVDIELQDPDKFNEIERLSVRLFEKNTENIVLGEIVTIIGNICIERKNDNPKNKMITVLYAESIEYISRKEESKLTEKDVEEITSWKRSIEEDQQLKNPIDELVRIFAPTIVENDHVKKGLLMVGANAGIPNVEIRIPRRLRLNALLIGDPGLAKSALLRALVQIIANARYESSQSSTGLSLTAQISKEDGGSHTLRLGPIPRAKGSVCALNEIGQMPVSDHKHLLDFMEEGWTTINKYGFNSTIAGHTSIIASANPINNIWKNQDRIENSEFPTLTQIIQRFDLIFIFREVTDPDTLRKYAKERDEIAKNFETGVYEKDEEFLRKYMMYARTFDPILTEDAKIMLREYWIGMAKADVKGLPRKLETLERIAISIAKLKLKSLVDAEEATEAMQFYNVILQNYQQTVAISKKPADTSYQEIREVVKEHNGFPISYVEATKEAYRRNEQVKYYLNTDKKLDLESNWKFRNILDLLRKDPSIDIVDEKPIVLRWKDDNNGVTGSDNNSRKEILLSCVNDDNLTNIRDNNEITQQQNQTSEESEASEVKKTVICVDERNVPTLILTHENKNSDNQYTEAEVERSDSVCKLASDSSDSSDSSINTYTESSPANGSYCYAEPISKINSTNKSNSADISYLQLKHSQAAHILTNDNASIEEGEEEE